MTIIISSVSFLVICLHSASLHENDPCESSSIAVKEKVCFDQFDLTEAFQDGLPAPILLSYSNTNMQNLCLSLSNITACLEDAMSLCTDPYFDFSSYRNTLRTICLNKLLLKNAETACDMETALGTCLQEYKHDVEDLKYYYYLNRTQPPIGDICTVINNTRDCIHINETEECTPQYSAFLTSLYRGRFMSSACSAKHNGVVRLHVSCSCLILFYVLAMSCIILNHRCAAD